MLKSIADAIAVSDYKLAAQLLKPLLQQEPNNLWARFYAGRVYEGRGKHVQAEQIYRQLLPKTSQPQLLSQLRKGLARLEAIAAEQREQALEQARAIPGGDRLGVLILEPVPNEQKTAIAREFSQIVQLDPYTARLQLPSRGWRLYRTGRLGELNYFRQAFQAVNVPSFCYPLEAIEAIDVYEIEYFQTLEPEITVRCFNHSGQAGALAFHWTDIGQRIIGRLPVFESVVVVDARHKLQRKTQTQDFISICDLHLPNRRCILRLCERHYQFKQGVSLSPPQSTDPGETVSQNWERLMTFLDRHLPSVPKHTEFDTFADSALDFQEVLSRLKSRVHLERREESLWDNAFQLYSGLTYYRHQTALPI
ncbi:MAG: tetratricopeptide repeat protein [Spirulinaceae cyanobacterium SM2_1_0]|nr:tetratricopeptide repeat protein [Spirulinaceae cyanobacterium SM2_1_0]